MTILCPQKFKNLLWYYDSNIDEKSDVLTIWLTKMASWCNSILYIYIGPFPFQIFSSKKNQEKQNYQNSTSFVLLNFSPFLYSYWYTASTSFRVWKDTIVFIIMEVTPYISKYNVADYL